MVLVSEPASALTDVRAVGKNPNLERVFKFIIMVNREFIRVHDLC